MKVSIIDSMKKVLKCCLLLIAMLVLVALFATLVAFLFCPNPARAVEPQPQMQPSTAYAATSTERHNDNPVPSSDSGHNFIPILMYHHFDPNPGQTGSAVITPEMFKSQLQYLKRLGYETITTEDLNLFLTKGSKLPQKPLLITIDDGYLSTYTHAYPILKELNIKATVFAIVSYRDKEDLMYSHFYWDQAKEMTDSGVIDIQSHTYASHYQWMDPWGCLVSATKRFNNENQTKYEERLRNDFLLAKNTLHQKLGSDTNSDNVNDNGSGTSGGGNVMALAFPYGYYDATIKKIAEETGHSLAFTINEGVIYPGADRLALPRINVPGHFTGADIEAKIKWLAKQEKPGRAYCRINGELAREQSVFRKGVIYMPVDSFCRMGGLNITWDVSLEDSIINIILDGKQIACPGFVSDGTPYVAVRPFADALGYKVQWIPDWFGDLDLIDIISAV